MYCAVMDTLIGHIDCDCYYVSAERVRHPELLGIPCGVLGNQGACVIAKSYEMKAMGVKTGTPVWEAKRICPEGIFIKRDFRWYEVLSRKLLKLLDFVSPQVEYYSIDEMFFDCNYLEQTFRQPLVDSIKMVQERVMQEIGLPTSIGVASTRTLAKLGSDSAKPFGVAVLTDEAFIEKFLASQPVGELCGIGRKSEQKLHGIGVRTCLQFRQQKRLRIRNLLTIKGEALWYELHGESVVPISSKRPLHQCIARGGSVGQKTADRARLNGMLIRNLERLIEALNHHQVLTDRLGLSLEFDGTTGWYNRVRLPKATASFQELAEAARQLMQRVHVLHPVSHMHLLAEGLVRQGWIQQSLFEQQQKVSVKISADKQLNIDQLKQKINNKIGRFALRSAETLEVNDLYQDSAHAYDICDIYGKSCF